MGFKLGKGKTPIASQGEIRTKMRFGKVSGDADASVPGTPHATDMKVGKLSYTDDYIMYNGDKFERETIDGKDMIRVDGQWKEAGDTGFPWEDDANNGEETAI